MVDVVQLVEHRIVVPSVVGSSPIIHPKEKALALRAFSFVVDDKHLYVTPTLSPSPRGRDWRQKPPVGLSAQSLRSTKSLFTNLS